MSRPRGILPVAFALLALNNGCIAHDPYPAAWPALPAPSAGDCRPLAGRYANLGEGSGSPQPSSLALVLFGHASVWDKAHREALARGLQVALEFPRPGTLEITVWDDKEKLFGRTLSSQAGEFGCEGSRLLVHRTGLGGGSFVFGLLNVSVELALSRDFLVAQVKESAGGIILVVPFGSAATNWHRFRRLAE